MISVELKPELTGDVKNRQLTYLVIGTEEDAEMTDQDAIDAVAAEAPTTYFDLFRNNVTIDTWKLRPNDTIGILSVKYGEYESHALGGEDVGEAAYEFAYQAQSKHIYYALDTRIYPGSGPDFGNAIRVNADREVEGIDIAPGSTTNVWRLTVPNGWITSEYEATVEGMMGSVNSAEFKGRPAGTMRFVQAQSSIVRGGSLSISWGFQYSPNRENLTIGGITGVDIGGHEEWWVLDEKKLDATNLVTVIEPKAVYVHQVHESADLNELGF